MFSSFQFRKYLSLYSPNVEVFQASGELDLKAEHPSLYSAAAVSDTVNCGQSDTSSKL